MNNKKAAPQLAKRLTTASKGFSLRKTMNNKKVAPQIAGQVDFLVGD